MWHIQRRQRDAPETVDVTCYPSRRTFKRWSNKQRIPKWTRLRLSVARFKISFILLTTELETLNFGGDSQCADMNAEGAACNKLLKSMNGRQEKEDSFPGDIAGVHLIPRWRNRNISFHSNVCGKANLPNFLLDTLNSISFFAVATPPPVPRVSTVTCLAHNYICLA